MAEIKTTNYVDQAEKIISNLRDEKGKIKPISDRHEIHTESAQVIYALNDFLITRFSHG